VFLGARGRDYKCRLLVNVATVAARAIMLDLEMIGFDNFYTGLSPHEPCVSSGFVFSSDQVCSEDYLVTGSMVGPTFPMDLVCIPAYLRSIQDCSGFPSSTA